MTGSISNINSVAIDTVPTVQQNFISRRQSLGLVQESIPSWYIPAPFRRAVFCIQGGSLSPAEIHFRSRVFPTGAMNSRSNSKILATAMSSPSVLTTATTVERVAKEREDSPIVSEASRNQSSTLNPTVTLNTKKRPREVEIKPETIDSTRSSNSSIVVNLASLPPGWKPFPLFSLEQAEVVKTNLKNGAPVWWENGQGGVIKGIFQNFTNDLLNFSKIKTSDRKELEISTVILKTGATEQPLKQKLNLSFDPSKNVILKPGTEIFLKTMYPNSNIIYQPAKTTTEVRSGLSSVNVVLGCGNKQVKLERIFYKPEASNKKSKINKP